MNPIRQAVHVLMESTGLDRHVDSVALNLRRERAHAKKFPVLGAREANTWIGDLIRAGKPAALGKIGDRECCALAAHLRYRQFYKYTWAAPSFGEAELFQQAGVFPPTDRVYQRFCEVYLSRLATLDACAVWENPGESRVLASHAPHARRIELQSLEPYFFPSPWSAALAGKRVLVVHPFATSIRTQYERRTELWPTQTDVLPAFEIEVIRSPYGFANNEFTDWFAMLAWLENAIAAAHRRHQIDVVLLGCGAAGLPLAAFAKSLGSIGIHTGGPTQLLFGIRGGRWDRLPGFQHFFNEAWTRPRADETPAAAQQVDRAGYW
ncbi:hypothetical protein [Oleiharenicola lentus]|uniref:hypothetical protein n=1 Tax=Oleiharenicola lentus TaxID=2508720 RepID=UPI003F662DF8